MLERLEQGEATPTTNAHEPLEPAQVSVDTRTNNQTSMEGRGDDSSDPGDSSKRSSKNNKQRTSNGLDQMHQIGHTQLEPHLFTEIEILPSSETNGTKKHWIERFSRRVDSTLVYRFRVHCALNYYGDGCSTFCRPRNDQFGHYSCSQGGHKSCHEGWSGAECDRAKCGAACNLEHGYCDKPDTCQCRPGWSGPRCDQCLTYPGCANGFCLAPWQCLCHNNWTGLLCDQQMSFCESQKPCKNNATCTDLQNAGYRCHCRAGFAGPDCEHATTEATQNELASTTGAYQTSEPMNINKLASGCGSSACLNGGTCLNFRQLADKQEVVTSPTDSATSTIMSRPSRGEDDQLQLELPAGLMVGRPAPSEQSVISYFRCQCPTGWTGDHCQWADAGSMARTELLEGEPALSANNNKYNPSSRTPNPANELAAFNGPTFIVSSASKDNVLDLGHLISGVMLASICAILMSLLILAWCCLFALRRHKLSLIQLFVIGSGDDVSSSTPNQLQTAASNGNRAVLLRTRIQRLHQRLRDSFRSANSGRLNPSSKLSLDNVLPPSYEESGASTTLVVNNKTSKSCQPRSISNNHDHQLHCKDQINHNHNHIHNNATNNEYQLNQNHKHKQSDCMTDQMGDHRIESEMESIDELRSSSLQHRTASHSSHHHSHYTQSHQLIINQPPQLSLVKGASPAQSIELELEAGNEPAAPGQIMMIRRLADDARLNCPRHGPIYRMIEAQLYNSNNKGG